MSSNIFRNPLGWRLLMANGESNGIKINTGIFIWLAALTLSIVFYAGVSIEKLNNIATRLSEREREYNDRIDRYELRFANVEGNLKALTLSYTRGERSLLLDDESKPKKGIK